MAGHCADRHQITSPRRQAYTTNLNAVCETRVCREMQAPNVLAVSWLLTLKQIAAALGDVPSDRTAWRVNRSRPVRSVSLRPYLQRVPVLRLMPTSRHAPSCSFPAP